jgi:uncharacterized protein YutE (UPF0331/DUF86 family)
VVDRSVLARKTAAILDAASRIRNVLPASTDDFAADRTTREVVMLNLFVALQESASLAMHWLADEGAVVPATYGEAFTALAERGVIDRDLAGRLRAAVGLRNLIAHQYGAIDARRVFAVARDDAPDLATFCQVLSARAGDAQ